MATLWSGTSVEYAACSRQTFQAAKWQLDKALSDPTWTACVEQEGDFSMLPPAVIMDIDETVLANTKYFARRALGKNAKVQSSFMDWVNEADAPLLPGAKSFIDYARDRGVRVFFVTNRTQKAEAGTRKNLQRVGISVDDDRNPDTVLMRNERPEWTRDKTTRRAHIAKDFRVLLLIGDDFNDFVSAEKTMLKRTALKQQHRDRWGVSWFALPNPTYGSWQKTLYNFESGLTAEEKNHRLEKQLALLE